MRKHCWTGALCVLLCCACLAGCGLLDREYRVTKEHSDRYWESESADILRAESYDDVVSDLLILIGRHTESATLRLYQFPDDAAAAEALEQAALEVQQAAAREAGAAEQDAQRPPPAMFPHGRGLPSPLVSQQPRSSSTRMISMSWPIMGRQSTTRPQQMRSGLLQS